MQVELLGSDFSWQEGGRRLRFWKDLDRDRS